MSDPEGTPVRRTGSGPRAGRLRASLFAALVGASVLVGVVYTANAALRDEAEAAAGADRSPVPPGALARVQAAPHLVFQNVVRGDGYANVAIASLEAPDGERLVTGLTCERVHFAGGRGLCLVPEMGLVASFWAITFGPDFRPLHRLALGGPPSRARVSPDGRFGAATVFVSGHSYADDDFSTETVIIDMTTGESIGDLEQFAVERHGEPFSAIDFNFWGVTFADDSNRFYATLRTDGSTFLVEGDVAARTMTVIRANVECPALSPDNTRIAFKKYVGEGSTIWRLHVLDLETMSEVSVAEARMIDDQVEWLDDDHIIYAYGPDLWAVPSDGSGTPERFVAEGLSPAVVR